MKITKTVITNTFIFIVLYSSFIIGFILGSMLENNFARAMNIYDGFGFIWERPMTAILLLLSVLLIFLPAIRSRLALRRQKIH